MKSKDKSSRKYLRKKGIAQGKIKNHGFINVLRKFGKRNTKVAGEKEVWRLIG